VTKEGALRLDTSLRFGLHDYEVWKRKSE